MGALLASKKRVDDAVRSPLPLVNPGNEKGYVGVIIEQGIFGAFYRLNHRVRLPKTSGIGTLGALA